MTIFGVPWQQLTLGDLERFLVEADPEPLLWEAKGVVANKGEIRKQVCGFANSHDGGYVIVGADQADDGSWTLNGVEFEDEPPTWVSNVIGNGGVNPYPDGLDTRSFEITKGRHVAVIRVPPIAAPPCNTHGTVYERVSGRTISVREPLRLAELFARGDQARQNAEATAHSAALRVLIEGREHPRHEPQRAQLGLGLSATGYLPDISSRLFTPRFDSLTRGNIGSLLEHGPQVAGPPRMRQRVTQESMVFESEATDALLGQSWVVRASWHGGVGVYWASGVNEFVIQSVVGGPVRQAWALAEETLRTLGPQGPRHLQLVVAGGPFIDNPPPYLMTGIDYTPPVIGRGPIAAGVQDDILASIERELRRTAGEMALEPDPD